MQAIKDMLLVLLIVVAFAIGCLIVGTMFRFLASEASAQSPIEGRRPTPNKPAPTWPPKAGSAIGGRELVKCTQYKGLTLTCDLPASQQMQNIGSKVDGSGMCVFTSVEMAARYQGLEQWRGFRDWCAQNYPGGGDPDKLAQLIAAYAKAKGLTVPPFVQYQGQSPEPVLDMIDKTGRMACFAYGYSPRYGSYINHMVCGPKFGKDLATVLDNNFTGETNYEWVTRAELVRRLKVGADQRGRAVAEPAWVFVWLTPTPPPIPVN